MAYYRYVEGIFCILPSDKLFVFNNFSPIVEFIHELETDCRPIFRQKYNLTLNWFHKPTYSGRVLNSSSNQSVNPKRQWFLIMFDKVLLLSD